MRLMVDENMSSSVIAALRGLGFDVLSVKETMSGDDDVVVLARAQAESRVVVTMDKDFGELAYRIGLPASCGVILFRLGADDPYNDLPRILDVVTSRDEWSGLFAVATEKRIRTRPLPPTT